MTENLRAGRAPGNSFVGRLIRAPDRAHFSRGSAWTKRKLRILPKGAGSSWRRRLAGGFSSTPRTAKTARETPAPQNHAKNLITVRAMVYGRYTPLTQGRPKAPFCA